jgi:hypothetical protein
VRKVARVDYVALFLEAYGDDPARCAHCACGLWYAKWVVHHIDHDHFNNDSKNLMALCRACHAAEHHVGRRDSEETRQKRKRSYKDWYDNRRTEDDFERERRLGQQLGLDNKGRKKHADFGGLQSRAQYTSRRRRCLTCGLECDAGGMANHVNARGHEGAVPA